MQQANVKAGVEVAKKALSGKNKGKNKLGSGVVTGGGSFQSMGLHPSLLRSLLIRGFTTPTPIQRQAIPAVMAQPPRDVVGMARTGSGKTLAYLIPLINRLNGRHSRTFGIKSLIFCPSRELAVQILRVGKEIARGWKADPGEGQDSRGEAIRWAMIVGGESLDEQFAIIRRHRHARTNAPPHRRDEPRPQVGRVRRIRRGRSSLRNGLCRAARGDAPPSAAHKADAPLQCHVAQKARRVRKGWPPGQSQARSSRCRQQDQRRPSHGLLQRKAVREGGSAAAALARRHRRAPRRAGGP
ncbi:hypothetical protein Golomagni_08112 [Golovinomyces magnicellulatus]|nr:hypothetical protein Golomagni_08112 [Golovinomyces magnicellulatus]